MISTENLCFYLRVFFLDISFSKSVAYLVSAVSDKRMKGFGEHMFKKCLKTFQVLMSSN